MRTLLKSYKTNKTLLETKQRLLNQLEICTDINATRRYEVFSKTNKTLSEVENRVLKHVETQELLVSQIDELEQSMLQVEILIASLPDKHREIMKLKYIDGEVWVYVATKTNRSLATCRRLENDSVAIIEQLVSSL